MKVLCVVGTRPEAIKMAPVILAFATIGGVQSITLFSGQHKHMVHPVFQWFGLDFDDQIKSLPDERSLSALTGHLFNELELAFIRLKPDIVLAQGDTTTTLVAALVSFYKDIPFGHVEAGLRTGNLRAPFPEELNRIVAGKVANWNFCPTKAALRNLLQEGVEESKTFVTGNTVIDALAWTVKRLKSFTPRTDRLRRVLVTVHRRENFGHRLVSICNAIKRIRNAYRDVAFVLPVHPNPQVRTTVQALLSGQERITLVPPLEYQELIERMMQAYFVMTDSGGIQEEAPFLRKPVLVLRDVTERPEAVQLGLAQLIGTDEESIVCSASELLSNTEVYARMASGGSPYGDGQAATRICTALGLAPTSLRAVSHD
jgi:UDP-N-acetylglucosamine 2-epimerase (non-hydrolysing)